MTNKSKDIKNEVWLEDKFMHLTVTSWKLQSQHKLSYKIFHFGLFVTLYFPMYEHMTKLETICKFLVVCLQIAT